MCGLGLFALDLVAWNWAYRWPVSAMIWSGGLTWTVPLSRSWKPTRMPLISEMFDYFLRHRRSTSSPRASRANRYLVPAESVDPKILGGSFVMFAELPRKPTPDGSSSKTPSGSSPPETVSPWHESVKRWPIRVSADGSGSLFELRVSGRRTVESDGFALLPTPTARDGRGERTRTVVRWRAGGPGLPDVAAALYTQRHSTGGTRNG